mgnify:CR=1 FL=1
MMWHMVLDLLQFGDSWARYVYKDCLPRFEKFAMNVMQVDPEGTADDVPYAE